MQLCCTSNNLESNYGEYYIDEKDVVHITWLNGFREQGKITYSQEGFMIFTIRGNYPQSTYSQWRCRW